MKQIWRILRGNHLLLSLIRWFDEQAGKEELESIPAQLSGVPHGRGTHNVFYLVHHDK